MSLKKKIAISFFISAFIIAILTAFEYVNFIEIRKEIRYLEITDTISRKSLQLRRHEKNYFLYSPQKADQESVSVRAYLGELKDLLAQYPDIDKTDNLSLRRSIHEYELRFAKIESSAKKLTMLFEKIKGSGRKDTPYIPLVEAAFLERPVQTADFLTRVFLLPPRHPLVTGLRELDADITALRKIGEDILVISKDLDKIARENAEIVIKVSQAAILVIFPVFLVTGVTMLFLITRNIVSRLRLLIDVMEKSGKGTFAHVEAPVKKWGNDEVGVLIRKFDDMEDELEERQAEIDQKNKELMQTKKLAAIGTLASGVAHELNNPLNNIYLSTQVMAKEAGENCSPAVKEVFNDILSQTIRVKKIVGDLLDFARGREPQLREVELNESIRIAWNRLGMNREEVVFTLDADPAGVILQADAVQLEQVFVNLFANAVAAMSGRGALRVQVDSSGNSVQIRVADSGKGMPRESLEKIFEPFFTTKDKGTGLGLAIVYNIIKKHGGDIRVASGEGKGTTFTITLPKGKSEHGV